MLFYLVMSTVALMFGFSIYARVKGWSQDD